MREVHRSGDVEGLVYGQRALGVVLKGGRMTGIGVEDDSGSEEMPEDGD
ncbi:hypothetical protein AAH991_04145 [Microbispora sp. ZYX-F-249]|uniref:Uncharacterized protein n=1 Tax=Microbispora maris TaxID=3144104 RepID=A0ABV0AGH9_9ACTN